MLMNIINRFAVPIIQIAELLAYYSKNYSRLFCPGLLISNSSIQGVENQREPTVHEARGVACGKLC